MQRKKKRSIIFELHSIPIKFEEIKSRLSNNRSLCKRLYLVSYSIPLSCMVVLLLTGIFAINPSLSLKASAVTIQDEWVVKENNSNSDSDSLVSENNDVSESVDPIDDSFGGFGGDEVGLSQEDIDAGMSLLSDVSPTLAITISNSTQIINTVQGGPTVYGSYNVGLTGSNVKDYTLSIKANSTNLTMPSGASSSTSTVSGAGGKTGDSMNANTWGYKLTETSTAESSYGTLNYASLPTALTQIANGTVASPYNLSTNKKLVFAAKFGDNAAPGKYTGSITLSFSATPAQTGQLWSNGTPSYITDMRDIKSGFCKDNSDIPAGATITLRDSRDGKNYAIYKAGDGHCWMGENLRLNGGTPLKTTDSDITSNWALPASSDSSWSVNNETSQMRNGKSDMTVSNGDRGDGKGWRSGFGNYYSWAAATAGTGTISVKDADAPSSICPLNWKLPAYSGDYSFSNLTSTKSSWLTGQTIDGTANMAGYYLGSTTTNLANGANFWPAAGGVDSNGLQNPGTVGYYWSRRAGSFGHDVRGLYLDSGGAYPQGSSNRYLGNSVRCVAIY